MGKPVPTSFPSQGTRARSGAASVSHSTAHRAPARWHLGCREQPRGIRRIRARVMGHREAVREVGDGEAERAEWPWSVRSNLWPCPQRGNADALDGVQEAPLLLLFGQ